jgi:hypothetical protein
MLRKEREQALIRIALVSAAGGQITVHPRDFHDAPLMTLHSWNNPADGSVTFKVERTPR